MNRKFAFLAYLSLQKLKFLIFLYVLAFQISFSAEFSMEIFLWPREQIDFNTQ